MKKSDVIIDYATIKDAREFFGDDWSQTFKGFSASLNGEVIGVAGIKIEKKRLILFSDMKDKARKYKKDIVKMINKINYLVKSIKSPIMAISDCNEVLSEKILTKLGFRFFGQYSEDGKVFWRL
jgi:hypothetical protein